VKLANPRLKSLDFAMLQEIVKNDSKNRYDLLYEAGTDTVGEQSKTDSLSWWIRANQGHSMKVITEQSTSSPMPI